MNLKQAAWFSAIPWGTMAVSGYFAGTTSDALIKSGYPVTLVRKIMQVLFHSHVVVMHAQLFFIQSLKYSLVLNNSQLASSDPD